jgi:signal transduction histidine kinase
MSHVSELSEQDFELSTFDLLEVWSDCVSASQPELKEKSVTLTQLVPNDSFVITGDRKKFSYAFLQLIAAAVRFTCHKGHISAEFSRGRNGEITVKIAEDGPGIPPQALRRIFDSSYTGTAPRSSPPPDSVVSLSGVYDVVGLHGGRMFANSPAGKGSTFLFTLPAVRLDGEEKLA